MTTTSQQDVFALALEVVDRTLGALFGTATSAYNLIESKMVDKGKVSERLFRQAVMTRRGGVSGKVNLSDEGSYPTGSSSTSISLVAGWQPYAFTYRWSDIQAVLTQGEPQSIGNFISQEAANATSAMQRDFDVLFHQAGDGILTNPCSLPVAGGGGTNTNNMTFAGATDDLGLNRIQGCEGMAVEVWGQLGAAGTKRAAADPNKPVWLETIDRLTGKITFNQTVNGVCPAGSQDILVFPGMTAFGPTALTTGSTTWPQQGGTAGLGGDSGWHGIQHYNSADEVAYVCGKSRATYPNLKANMLSAASAPLSWAHGRAVRGLIAARWGSVPTGYVWLGSSEQMGAIEDLTVTIAQLNFAPGDTNRAVDLGTINGKSIGDFGRTLPYCGFTVLEDARQPKSRLDGVLPGEWCRITLEALKLVPGEGGGPTTIGRTAAGGRAPFSETTFRSVFDWTTGKPGQGAAITSLTRSTTYNAWK